MGRSEIRNICKVSLDEPAENQPKLHNRWHPDIPFADTIKNGETVKIECVDWTGGQISKCCTYIFINMFSHCYLRKR
jgi:formamidase